MSKNRSPGLLQINKQDQKCLLAVNPIQNVVFYRGETIWFSSPVNKTVTSINRDPWKATCLRNLSFLLFVNNWTLKNITVSYVVKYTNDQCVHLLVISQRVQTKWSRNTYVSPCLSRLVIMRWPYVTRASFTLKMDSGKRAPLHPRRESVILITWLSVFKIAIKHSISINFNHHAIFQ